ncbi:hypothetical protein BLGI_3114 [Brevibacillus laterosporus GI-9]|nr:hypothetical protein BLGI_3114 [Brevibacillus laterosporus GI-9]
MLELNRNDYDLTNILLHSQQQVNTNNNHYDLQMIDLL